MFQLTQFAQAATYNCDDSSDNTYGAGSFGTCDTSTTTSPTTDPVATPNNTSTTQPVGAPNTGQSWFDMAGGNFSLIAPVIIAIVVVAAVTAAFYKKKTTK